MRRSSQRLVQTLDAAASRRPSYICKSCLHPSSTISASSSQVRTYASSTASEETWRKRLWGEKEVEKQDAVAEGLEQPAKAATTVPEEEVLDENYVPALSIEGLRRVGGKKEYPASHTRLEARFAGFKKQEPMTDPNRIYSLLRYVVWETVARSHGLMPEFETSFLGKDFRRPQQINQAKHDIHLTAGDAPGQFKLLFADEAAQRSASQAWKVQPSKLNQVAADANAKTISFLDFPLEDPATKFMVFKRVTQMSGHHIPDAVITKATTMRTLFNALIPIVEKATAPKKLGEKLVASPKLKLENVDVREKKVRKFDKEKAVGRWKVIEEELIARGLPVPGAKPEFLRRRSNPIVEEFEDAAHA